MSIVAQVAPARPTVGVGGPRYDGWMAGLCGLFQIGAYLDLWAHVHRPELETFFTPWHAVLYSGFFAVAAATAAPLVLRRRPGVSWRRTLPAGYDLSLIGVLVFFLGGVLDMLWHTLFGVEPTSRRCCRRVTSSSRWARADAHRTATGRVAAGTGGAPWPAVLSLGYLLSSLTFWTQYVHHLGRPWAAAGNRPTSAVFRVVAPDPLFRGVEIQSVYVAHALGVASVLLQAALVTGVVLIALWRWGAAVPAGAFTVVLGLNALLVGMARDQYALILPAVVAGAATDLPVRRLRPSRARPSALRLVAAATPATYFALFFLAVLAITRGLWWSVPMWSGAIVLAGGVGWLLSWLLAPPPIPAESNR